MRAVIQVLLGFLAIALVSSNEKKIVCYFGSWAVYRTGNGNFPIDKIDPTLCTHLIYSFVGLNAVNGEVRILDPWADLSETAPGGGKDGFNLFNNLKIKNPKLKTMLAMGGWNEGSSNYSKVMADETLRKNLAENIYETVVKYGFDGFDLDWEYPAQRGGSPADKHNMILLLRDLKEKFSEQGLLLSAAVGASETIAKDSYNIAELSKYLDFINLMEYDFHDVYEPITGHNAPLYIGSYEANKDRSVSASVNYWISKGAAPEKLVMGIPLYGKGFKLANPSNYKANAPTSGPSIAGPYTQQPGMLGYNEICEKIVNDKWKVGFDDEQKVPYVHGGNQWLSFDNEQSISIKADFVKKNNLGGMMVWSIETDDFLGTCKKGEYPLLNAINRSLKNDNTISQQNPNIPQPTKKPQTTQTTQEEIVITTTTPRPRPIEFPENMIDYQSDEDCKEPGDIRNPRDCTSYITCLPIDNGLFIKYTRPCPGGLHFDAINKRCNYPEDAKCQISYRR